MHLPLSQVFLSACVMSVRLQRSGLGSVHASLPVPGWVQLCVRNVGLCLCIRVCNCVCLCFQASNSVTDFYRQCAVLCVSLGLLQTLFDSVTASRTDSVSV